MRGWIAARVDALIAVVLWVLAQVEVWLFWDPGEVSSQVVAAVAVTVIAAALAMRRRAPLTVVGVIALVYAVWSLIAVPEGPLWPFVMTLVATYTVAEQTLNMRVAAAGLLCGLAGPWIEITIEAPDVANYAFTGVVIVGVWLAGRGMRGRQARADRLQQRAVELVLERDTKARAAVAEERARIARELHDVVAHSVGVMVIQAQAAQQVTDADGPAGPSLRSIESTGQQALVDMRRLLGLLRSEDEELALAPQPSLSRVAELVENVNGAGMPVELTVEGDPVKLPPGVDLSAYRIVQEALTNALKHAGPARARVAIRYARDEVELEITDDGTGRPGNGTGGAGGHGLVGMRERVSVYGGRIETGGRSDGGYAVRVRLPFERAVS